eukprot:g15946.t1
MRHSGGNEDCRNLCSDAADCMAYQYSAEVQLQSTPKFVPTWYATKEDEEANQQQDGWSHYCVLWLWHRVPIGVFGLVEIGRSDFSYKQKAGLLEWRDVSCMRKVVQFTDRRSRFQLEAMEKFAIMPRERDLNGGSGLDRFCTCRATTPTGGDDTEEKETVCRVADEKENMSQEAAESLCLERNRREALLRGSTNEKDRESAARGCAGFMSFTPLFSAHHPKAKHVHCDTIRMKLLRGSRWHDYELICRGACTTWEITMVDVRRGRGALGLGRQSVWKFRGALGLGRRSA